MKTLSQKRDDAWRIRCYDSSGGRRRGFHGWFDRQLVEVQARLEAALEIIRQSSNPEGKLFEHLRGNCEGLAEIRVDPPEDAADETAECVKIVVRVLAFVGPGRRDITLLRGFAKVTGAEYGRECHQALEQKRSVLKNERIAPDFEA